MNADEHRFETGRGNGEMWTLPHFLSVSAPLRRWGLLTQPLGIGTAALTLVMALFAAAAWTPAVADNAGGRLVALVRDPVTATEYLAHVDALSGAVTPVGDGLVGCCTPVGLDGALDAAGRRYYAVMTLDVETTPRIVAFDADTGAATVGATLATTAAVNFLAYDSATARLVALLFDAAANRQRLAQLNPATGAVTWLGDGVPDCCSITTAFDAALDAASRRLYAIMRPFTGTAVVLYGFNMDTGNVESAIPLSSTFSINFLAFDPDQGQLLAIANDPQADAERLGTLDPAAGALALRGEGAAGCCNLFVTDAAIDPAVGSMVAPMLDSNAEARLYSFDIASGAVRSQPRVGGGFALHYLAYLPAPANSLYLPLIQSAQPAARAAHSRP